MGLFTNKKKLCPLCGAPTPRLLATCVADQPLCKECAAKIDLPDGALDRMSVANLKQYMTVYEENRPLREQFHQTYGYTFGLLAGSFVVDAEHRLFRLRASDDTFVMTAASLASFRITEDGRVLFDYEDGALRWHKSDAPKKAAAMQPLIGQFLLQKQQYENMEERNRLRAERQGEKPASTGPEPTFDVVAPVRKFALELTLRHPYWTSFRKEINAPDFNRYQPSAEDYVREYESKVSELRDLANALAHVVDPACREVTLDDSAAPAAAVAAPAASDTASELRKYNELFDSGVITQEEFSAKKKQLLGI